jgi:hypothetical protein
VSKYKEGGSVFLHSTREISTRLHGITAQKTAPFLFTAVRSSNLVYLWSLHGGANCCNEDNSHASSCELTAPWCTQRCFELCHGTVLLLYQEVVPLFVQVPYLPLISLFIHTAQSASGALPGLHFL